jgi:hypothetical protein
MNVYVIVVASISTYLQQLVDVAVAKLTKILGVTPISVRSFH